MPYYRVVINRHGEYRLERCWKWWPFTETVSTYHLLETAQWAAEERLKSDSFSEEVISIHRPKD